MDQVEEVMEHDAEFESDPNTEAIEPATDEISHNTEAMEHGEAEASNPVTPAPGIAKLLRLLVQKSLFLAQLQVIMMTSRKEHLGL